MVKEKSHALQDSDGEPDCGICHSDAMTKEGTWPGIEYPRVPGHEVAGLIDAVGAGVVGWVEGQRVGVGWHGGHCGYCDSCRRGDFVTCQVAPKVPGIAYDGGYAEYMIAPASALASIPEGLSAVDAGPLMCAGITTFNSLRNSGARPGDLVAVLGIGGLGHLGVQYAAKMGFKTVAIARGLDKEPLARKLGACAYIDSKTQYPAAELLKLGGAKVVLATATSGEAMSATLGGLGSERKFDHPRRHRRTADRFPRSADIRAAVDHGLAVRQLHRFAGYALLQRAHRRAGDE